MAGIMRHRHVLVSVVAAAIAVVAAACSKGSPSPSSPSGGSCSVTLGAVPTTVAAAGTTGTIAVTAASSCAWTAQSSATFLTVTSGASGTGNGSVGYTVAANTGAVRSASISINGTVVSFTQSAATLAAPTGCTVTLSTTSLKINSGGGSANVDVTAAANCSWTAASNASFLTATANAAGNGTVAIAAGANNGQARTGTVTIGGQTVTVSQDAGIFAAFDLLDPGQTAGATNVCQFRGAAGSTTTCTLRSTSYTQGAAPIVSYAWALQYTYGTVITINSTGSSSSQSFSESCGKANSGATDEGALQPLDVTLTVTDSLGNTSTAKAGSGNQQPLYVQLFNCGK
jgi:hypothetical protein